MQDTAALGAVLFQSVRVHPCVRRRRRRTRTHTERVGPRRTPLWVNPWLASSDTLSGMFYFFQRGAEFLQCEIRGDDAIGYDIIITEPKRPERREHFATSAAAYERWLKLQETLVAEGWWGPHGRD
jgi:hypothetical protein